MEGHSSSTQQWEVVRGTLGSLNSPHLEHLRLTGLWVWMLVAALLVVMLALPLGPDFGRSPLELAAALATFSWPGGERAEVREQLLQNVCAFEASSINAHVCKWDLEKRPWATPCRCGMEAERSFSPDCRVGDNPRAKLIAGAALTWQVNCLQQNAQWHHKPGTARQFLSVPPLVFNH